MTGMADRPSIEELDAMTDEELSQVDLGHRFVHQLTDANITPAQGSEIIEQTSQSAERIEAVTSGRCGAASPAQALSDSKPR